MTFPIFIGWAGPYSHRLANAIENAILLSVEGVDPFIAEPEDLHGLDWLRRLKLNLDMAQAAIFILSPETQNSWWVPFEFGIWSSRIQRRNLENAEPELLTFPFSLSRQPTRVELALPEGVNFLRLSPTTFFDLIVRISQAANRKLKFDRDLDNYQFREIVWNPIARILGEGEQELAQAISKETSRTIAAERIGRLGPGRPTPESVITTIDAFTSTFAASDELGSAIGGILENASACAAELFTASDDPWIEQEARRAVETLRGAALALKEIRGGELVIFKEDNLRGFYKNNVIGMIRRSMWTTNLSSYDGSFGRTADQDILKAHRYAHDRGAELIRVFAIKPSMEGEIRSKLCDVLAAQRGSGVKTFLINFDAMNDAFAANRSALRIFGSPDIMILDENRVYVTQVDGAERVTGIRLMRGGERVEAALQLKRGIMKEAVEVFEKNFDESWHRLFN